MASKLIELFIKKALFKKGGAMASNKSVKFSADALEKRLKALGIDPTTINTEAELNQILAYVKQAEDAAFNQMKVLSGKDAENALKKLMGQKTDADVFDLQGNKLNPNEPIMGGTQGIETLLKKGDITKGTVTKKSDKVKDREMFKAANERFKKTETEEEILERLNRENKETVQKIKNRKMLDEAIEDASPGFANDIKYDAEIVAENLAERRGLVYDDLPTKERLKLYDEAYTGLSNQRFKNKPKPDDDEPGFYTGGIVDVEPNLSDIGHGSDALMSRTRLMSPGSQATTSTGLNYLLAEDNDNIRVPFSKGKIAKEILDKGRRGFMKAAGAGAAGLAALKTGLIGLGEKATPVVEKVTENFSTTLSEAPSYFFDLATKIKSFGKKSEFGPQERIDEYSYTGKNGDQYTLTEDIVTGDAQITKDKMGAIRVGEDDMADGIVDRSVMEYKAPKQDVDVEAGKGTREAAEYEEYRVEFDQDGTQAGADAIDESVQKEIIEEASEKITKKADGGRIGYSKGSLIKQIGSRTLAFLEKVFGKETMAEMPKRDPEMYQGLLEVTEAFRARDKEGLKMYLQKFLPHMDDTEIEDFIIGSDGTEGLKGQLIRLGSGRDYAGKLEMIKRSEEMKKLRDLDVTEDMKRKPNASGGLAKLLGE